MHFLIHTTEGDRSYPRDFQRGWTLLFYYEGDFLPVSATELLGLAALAPAFGQQDCTILCLSPDRIPSHLAFLETLNRYRLAEYPAPITFPLGSDPSGTLRERLQLAEGKKYIWLIAPDGEPKAQFCYPFEVGANFTEILRTLSALQTQKPTPCGWVPGANTLCLPPSTRSESCHHMTATEREGGIAIDWYLSFEGE